MNATITKKGALKINAENSLETFALNRWLEVNREWYLKIPDWVKKYNLIITPDGFKEKGE
jgi:hypothetical protein